jgi:hypothetical protein
MFRQAAFAIISTAFRRSTSLMILGMATSCSVATACIACQEVNGEPVPTTAACSVPYIPTDIPSGLRIF